MGVEIMDTKRCSKCGEVKGLGEFTFKNKSKNIYHSHCKKCVKVYRNTHPRKYDPKYAEEYRRRNKNNIKEFKHNYYARHKDKINQYKREHRKNNKDIVNEKGRKRDKNRRDKLTDNYVKKRIIERTGISRKYISYEMVELQRIILTAKRELKKHKQLSA